MTYRKTGDGGNGGGLAPSNMDGFIFDKWLPFAQEFGFVANQAPSPGSAPNRELWTYRGVAGTPDPTLAPLCFFRTKDDALFLMTGLDENLAQEIFDQPDNPANGPDSTAFNSDWTGDLSVNLATPIVNGADPGGSWSGHHLFTDGTSVADASYIHAVIQISARQWRHFHIGRVLKYGTWVGGNYMFGHFHHQNSGRITDPYDGFHIQPFGGMAGGNNLNNPQKNGTLHCEGFAGTGANNTVIWLRSTVVGIDTIGASGKSVGDVNRTNYDMGHFKVASYAALIGGGMWSIQKSLLANASPLAPMTVFGKLEFNSVTSWAALGTIPDVFRVNMKDFSPAESITIGSDEYIVFPAVNSNIIDTVNGDEYTGFEGYAYRVIPN